MRNSSLQYNKNNYYPFGLQHGSYNTPARDYRPIGDAREIETVDRNPYKYKYQGQERQDELGLNWDSFKWRNYDYAIGRFMSVDPLADKYTYNSPYAFQENKMGLGIELEGLEVKRLRGGLKKLGKAYDNFMKERVFNLDREMALQSPDAKTRKEAEIERQQINNSITYDFATGTMETIKGSVTLTGGQLENLGDAITWIGYGGAAFTEGTSLLLVPIGEGVSAVGTVMVTVVKLSDDGVTTEVVGTVMINLSTNGAGKLLDKLSKNGDVGGLDDIFTRAYVDGVIKLFETGANEVNEQMHNDQSETDPETQDDNAEDDEDK